MSESNPTGLYAFSLEGEVALVTGAGAGLGLAVASRMAECGAKVALVGRSRAPLDAAAKSIGENAIVETHDVADGAGAEGLVDRVAKRLGPVSILVNNAGNHLKKLAIETGDDELERILKVHIGGAFALTRAAAPGMIARGGGSILFMASMASLFGIPQLSAYAVAKSGMLGLVRTLAVELGGHGIRVNAIAPGWIETAMSRKALDGDPERRDKILARTCLGRFGSADDIAWAAVYLASPAARFVTGAVLPVDGGVSIGF